MHGLGVRRRTRLGHLDYEAVHSDQVYRVQIYKVDGKQFDAREYKLDAGEHTIDVTLVLETQWAPKLKRIAGGATYEQAITITVEDGVTYELGGKVDPDASDEAQRDGSFWHPVIYREKK
jgi:hypothetical protein